MMKRGLILVEGPSEERFVKTILKPTMQLRNLYLDPKIIETKRTMSGGAFRGGVTSYSQFKRDILRLLPITKSGAIVSTMIDYYRLPADFPGMNNRPNGAPEVRVAHVEQSIYQDLGEPVNCIIYLSLHEFEALLFSDTAILAHNLLDSSLEPALTRIRKQYQSPEHINERPNHNPASLIEECSSTFRKTIHGVNAAINIGIERMRAECRHFNEWIIQLEEFSTN